MAENTLSVIEFRLEWKSSAATHTDIYHVHDVDTNKDTLPAGFAEQIAALKINQKCKQTYQAKDLLGEAYSSENVKTFSHDLFNTNFKGQNSPAMLYRFYPSAIAHKGLNTQENDFKPFRLIAINDDNMIADSNHPLAKYYLNLSATKTKEFTVTNKHKTLGRNIGKLICTKGPGMQAPFEFGDPIFFKHYPFKNHTPLIPTKPAIEPNTLESITALYAQLIPEYSKILDLMSTESSYLDDNFNTGLLNGIGANETKLNANQRLDTYQIQDLNSNVILPFEDNSFDDAICTFAIDYFTNPIKILLEISRVVNSGGKFIVTFSNAAATTQSIPLWLQLHPFERIQLVVEYFRQTEMFIELNTYSERGKLTDSADKANPQKHKPEPLYAVWGTVK